MKLQVPCCIALLLIVSVTQAQVSDQSAPTIRVSTRIVNVPIVATGANSLSVEDLRASELRIFDNGKPQKIASFEAMEPSAAESAESTGISQNGQLGVARNDLHYSIILLDALNSTWSDQIYARRAVEHLLDYFPAGQRIAIFVLGDHLYLLHDFSSNAAELRAALHGFAAGEPQGGATSSPSQFSAESSRPKVPSFSNLVGLHEGGTSAETLFYQRNRIVQTLETLTAIADLVKHISGQKDLLWVSSAFPLTLPGRREELIGDSFYDQMEQTTHALSSAGLRVYPIDPGGLSPDPKPMNIATMRQMARETGGEAFYNSNGLTSEMHLALQDTRRGYLLTYSPNDFHPDGSFHKIRVRVSRHGVKLRYRPGYYAEPSPTPEEHKAATNRKK